MTNYALAGRQAELTAQRDAQLVRLDRYLQSLENFARQRVEAEIEAVAERLNVQILEGLVADVKDAAQQYRKIKTELERL